MLHQFVPLELSKKLKYLKRNAVESFYVQVFIDKIKHIKDKGLHAVLAELFQIYFDVFKEKATQLCLCLADMCALCFFFLKKHIHSNHRIDMDVPQYLSQLIHNVANNFRIDALKVAQYRLKQLRIKLGKLAPLFGYDFCNYDCSRFYS